MIETPSQYLTAEYWTFVIIVYISATDFVTFNDLYADCSLLHFTKLNLQNICRNCCHNVIPVVKSNVTQVACWTRAILRYLYLNLYCLCNSGILYLKKDSLIKPVNQLMNQIVFDIN